MFTRWNRGTFCVAGDKNMLAVFIDKVLSYAGCENSKADYTFMDNIPEFKLEYFFTSKIFSISDFLFGMFIKCKVSAYDIYI